MYSAVSSSNSIVHTVYGLSVPRSPNSYSYWQQSTCLERKTWTTNPCFWSRFCSSPRFAKDSSSSSTANCSVSAANPERYCLSWYWVRTCCMIFIRLIVNHWIQKMVSCLWRNKICKVRVVGIEVGNEVGNLRSRGKVWEALFSEHTVNSSLSDYY